MQTKVCTHCNQEKPLSDFGKSGSKNNFKQVSVRYKPRCKPCTNAQAKQWREKNPDYFKRNSGKLSNVPNEDKVLMSAIRTRLHEAKQRVKRSRPAMIGLDCNVTDTYLLSLWKKQDGKCALSGVDMSLVVKKPTTLSLDKIDPSKGYVEGNCQWLAWAVNRAKGDMSQGMFIDMCNKVQRLSKEHREVESSRVDSSESKCEAS